MTALLIVDVQNDFCPGGALPVKDGDNVIPVINRLAAGFEHVLMTQDWHPAGHLSFASSHPGRSAYETIQLPYGSQVLWPDHCIQGSHGADFHADLDTARVEVIIRKGFRRSIDSYSAFFENDGTTPTGLAGYLRERGIDTIYLTGLATDFCVYYSAMDGRKQGFSVTVVEDATRGIDVNGSLGAAWKAMQAAEVNRISSQQLL